MNVALVKATVEDAREIHTMQLVAFKALLERYHDDEISPGAETVDKVIARLEQSTTDYYIIRLDDMPVGAIRISNQTEQGECRISPLFILPEYQNRGIAQEVFRIIETMYKPEQGWSLDTILEEKGNCHLYEKMGYARTGEVKRINDSMHIVFYRKG